MVSYLESVDPAWLSVKPKSFSEVVPRNMEPGVGRQSGAVGGVSGVLSGSGCLLWVP